MNIRPFRIEDAQKMLALFNETIRTINIMDYSYEQVMVWAPYSRNIADWTQNFAITTTYVAEQGDMIIGFANLTNDGKLDCLYTHRNFQNKGVATKLLQTLEEIAEKQNIKRIYTESSITAKTFFEKCGYEIVTPQQKRIGETVFLNYMMKKKLVAPTMV